MRKQLSILAPVLLCLASAGATPSPAKAEGNRRKGVRTCVKYQQELGGDKQSVELRLVNGCDSGVSCELSWTLRCDGKAAGAREEVQFALTVGEQRSVTASAASCGEKGWHVQNVRWRCASSEADADPATDAP